MCLHCFNWLLHQIFLCPPWGWRCMRCACVVTDAGLRASTCLWLRASRKGRNLWKWLWDVVIIWTMVMIVIMAINWVGKIWLSFSPQTTQNNPMRHWKNNRLSSWGSSSTVLECDDSVTWSESPLPLEVRVPYHLQRDWDWNSCTPEQHEYRTMDQRAFKSSFVECESSLALLITQ